MATTSTELRTDTRTRILDATFDAVLGYGLSRMTVEDVAQRAGVSRQTVYRYFPSKDLLVVGLVAREEERFIDGVRAAIQDEPDLRRAFERASAFVLTFAREHELLDRLLAFDREAILPVLTTEGGFVIARAREATLEIVAERLPAVDLERVRPAVDALTRATLSYVLTPSERPVNEIAATIARLIAAELEREGGPR